MEKIQYPPFPFGLPAMPTTWELTHRRGRVRHWLPKVGWQRNTPGYTTQEGQDVRTQLLAYDTTIWTHSEGRTVRRVEATLSWLSIGKAVCRQVKMSHWRSFYGELGSYINWIEDIPYQGQEHPRQRKGTPKAGPLLEPIPF